MGGRRGKRRRSLTGQPQGAGEEGRGKGLPEIGSIKHKELSISLTIPGA